jgi:hypothetical protein
MRLWRIPCFFVVVAFLGLGTAGFGESQGRTQIFRFSIGPEDFVVFDCGDFNIRNSFGGTARINLRLDAAGNVAGEIDHAFLADSVYYNESDPSMSIEAHPEHFTIRFANGYAIFSGISWDVRIPGQGVVVVKNGHWRINLATGEEEHLGGQDDVTPGNFQPLCEALRPR